MSSLADFGVAIPTDVLRASSERDSDGNPMHVCPKCRFPVAASKGTQTIYSPTFADEDVAERLEELGELVTHGWSCDRHAAPLVLPSKCGGSEARGFIDGWVGVRLVFSDGLIRHVPVPEREVEP